jgi:hypothetical protein
MHLKGLSLREGLKSPSPSVHCACGSGPLYEPRYKIRQFFAGGAIAEVGTLRRRYSFETTAQKVHPILMLHSKRLSHHAESGFVEHAAAQDITRLPVITSCL